MGSVLAKYGLLPNVPKRLIHSVLTPVAGKHTLVYAQTNYAPAPAATYANVCVVDALSDSACFVSTCAEVNLTFTQGWEFQGDFAAQLATIKDTVASYVGDLVAPSQQHQESLRLEYV
ncbi:hypothetical protein DYB25_008287 [Aphanomyces astaci]|uniref:Uncharacterized protein n=1 Tax=Aphanomyces astaci TaxID=112090 RepID=A0A397BJ66_APHAT|nr:hypothetical protein DYB25_008287 [Aphanomyces astaci]RHY19862.1 hypothetical protein DYB36_010751 [Aphanomyces astaci]RHY44383.1 hypothetical protein DYB30_005657 [Aphanomyces astaci]RHY44849.1 hypothetical protein DYB38_008828 [Aphanomyces astaci]RHY59994.1 hypothetical protein DYB34_006341 [Aphanomyces astaci]